MTNEQSESTSRNSRRRIELARSTVAALRADQKRQEWSCSDSVERLQLGHGSGDVINIPPFGMDVGHGYHPQAGTRLPLPGERHWRGRGPPIPSGSPEQGSGPW
jgi:hypothetical protein